MKLEYAKYLMEKTKDYFDKNVEGFSGSRKWGWPEFEELKKYVKSGERVLDLGCGNGRLFELFKDRKVEYFGVDFSEKLIEKAREKYGEHFQVADILSLPFPDNYFDSVWSIAVLHHIPSKILRLKALMETKRVLKPNGKTIATCWYLFRPFFRRKDILLSPKKLKIQRYYHAFTKKELKKLFQNAGFKIEELKYLKRNGPDRRSRILDAKRREKKTNILIVGTKL